MRTLALGLVSLLLALVATEIVLRTTHAFGARLSWTEPDALIGWRFTPSSEYWFFKENDHAITGRINALGWRDRERTRAKAAGVTRVAVLGDSYVEAFQVELDSTFIGVAERLLHRPAGPRYEFMNFGRSGMSPAEELLVLERDVLPCDPDVVVLVFTPHNDIADVSAATTTDRDRPFYGVGSDGALRLDTLFCESRGFRARKALSPLKQRSALVSLVIERVNAWRWSRNARSIEDPGAGGATRALTREQTLMTARPDSMYTENYTLAKRLVAEMARRCEANGVAFVTMCVPLVCEPHDVDALRSLDPTLDPVFFERDLSALADAAGFALVPLTDAFFSHYRRGGEPLYWSHWNYRGHRAVGTALASAIVARHGAPLDDHN